MAISAPFASEREADDAYYGDSGGDGGGGGGGDGGGGGETWGELQQGSSLGSGWTLAYQDQQNGDRRRWFTIRMNGDTLQALNSSGKPVDAKESDTLSDLPHYSTEDDARAAFKAWAENSDEQDDQQQSEEWEKWSKVSTEKPWHIYTRTHKSEDRAQFLAVGTVGGGNSVYLAPGGKVEDDPHVYDSADALSKALQAYYERANNGEIPDDRRPTGDDPGAETVRKEATSVKTSSEKTMERLVEKMGGKKVALAAVAVGGLAVYQSRKNGGS